MWWRHGPSTRGGFRACGPPSQLSELPLAPRPANVVGGTCSQTAVRRAVRARAALCAAEPCVPVPAAATRSPSESPFWVPGALHPVLMQRGLPPLPQPPSVRSQRNILEIYEIPQAPVVLDTMFRYHVVRVAAQLQYCRCVKLDTDTVGLRLIYMTPLSCVVSQTAQVVLPPCRPALTYSIVLLLYPHLPLRRAFGAGGRQPF